MNGFSVVWNSRASHINEIVCGSLCFSDKLGTNGRNVKVVVTVSANDELKETTSPFGFILEQ